MRLNALFVRGYGILLQWRAQRQTGSQGRTRRGAGRSGFTCADVLCLEERAMLAAPTVTQGNASIPVTATSLVIAGTNFDATASHNSVFLTDTVSGITTTVTPTTATTTSLTVSLSGLGTLTGGDRLTAIVTTNGVSSGAAVQVAKVAAVVTPSTTVLSSINLTIAGIGFDPVPAHNVLSLRNNGVPISATVISGTASSLTVAVGGPVTAGTLSAVVTINGVSSGAAVQVATIQPVVTPSSSTLMRTAKSIVIRGLAFDPNHAQNTVQFNLGAKGVVTSWTRNSITVTFLVKPQTTGTLTAIVTTRGISSGSTGIPVATVV